MEINELLGIHQQVSNDKALQTMAQDIARIIVSYLPMRQINDANDAATMALWIGDAFKPHLDLEIEEQAIRRWFDKHMPLGVRQTPSEEGGHD